MRTELKILVIDIHVYSLKRLADDGGYFIGFPLGEVVGGGMAKRGRGY